MAMLNGALDRLKFHRYIKVQGLYRLALCHFRFVSNRVFTSYSHLSCNLPGVQKCNRLTTAQMLPAPGDIWVFGPDDAQSLALDDREHWVLVLRNAELNWFSAAPSLVIAVPAGWIVIIRSQFEIYSSTQPGGTDEALARVHTCSQIYENVKTGMHTNLGSLGRDAAS